MAIERMEMLNLVGPLDEINPIVKRIVMLGNVHIVNALNEIDESNFTIDVVEENIHELVGMTAVRPYREDVSYKGLGKMIQDLMEYFELEFAIQKDHVEGDYDFAQTAKEIEKIYDEVRPVYREIQRLEEVFADLKAFEGHIQYLRGLDIEIGALNQLEFFDYKVGILSRENRLKIKKNYENISAIVLHIGSDYVEGEVYMVISPRELQLETDRILRSLNFQEISMPKAFSGNPKEIKEKLEEEKKEVRDQLDALSKKMASLKEQYAELVACAYSRLKMEEEMTKVKNELACTNNFFYLAGWVPQSAKEALSKQFEAMEDSVIIAFKDPSEVHAHMTPPTKMKNNWLFRPFESLVHMYGVPSYNEIDPTMFLTLTYLFLFGAMFGDVGQGLVILLAGLFLRRKEGKEVFGEIFVRLGTSSTIFGFLYGSIFGFEHVLPALLIRPMENIDQMLISSVVLGVILLLFSFVISMINAWKQKDLKEGLLGRNGLTGLIFYISLLIVVLNIATGRQILPNPVCYFLIVATLAVIFIREPLSNLLLKKRPLYSESASSYYVESGFEVFETILNMLSNTLSFIRVGAFALNHVGLFVAFHTMAEITGSFAGSIVIYIIGNIIVIGLEGLIVFIQGLRLEYYEMFSKYYKGEGILFNPIKLNFKEFNLFKKTKSLAN
ncbi:MAG TPA: V-type ATP synthase subunit I [Clostridiales bacterium]|nr:V-type ATP synthase subunit I [Clostridiales bacterium]